MRAPMPALVAAAALAQGAGAQTPPYDIPQPLAQHMVSGKNVRLIVLGDSITNSVFGTFWGDGADRSHFPPQNGFHNVWMPAAGWRGVIVPPVGTTSETGGYSNWRGVGAFVRHYDGGRYLAPRVDLPDLPGTPRGWVVDGVSLWTVSGQPSLGQQRMTSYLYTPLVPTGELNHWSQASARIGRGDLLVRHVVLTGPDLRTVPKLTFTRTGDAELTRDLPAPGPAPRWDFVEYPAASPDSTWNRDTHRFETSSRLNYQHEWGAEDWHYATAGTLFYDASSQGMTIGTVAQGGWNTIDHLRQPHTFGQPGFYYARNRGVADDGLLSWLDAFDMTAPDRVPVVMITLGTNIAMPDNGGAPESFNGLTTQAYAQNIRAIIARWRSLYAQRAHDPYFILVASYDWANGYPNPFIDSRADWLWEVRQTDPKPDRIGFVSLPATMGYLGAGFSPSWYFSPMDPHLSSDGAVRYAQVLWNAFLDERCIADHNRNGVLSTDDFFDFLDDYTHERLDADLTTTAVPGAPGYAVPDSLFTADDFFYFLQFFAQGCQ